MPVADGRFKKIETAHPGAIHVRQDADGICQGLLLFEEVTLQRWDDLKAVAFSRYLQTAIVFDASVYHRAVLRFAGMHSHALRHVPEACS